MKIKNPGAGLEFIAFALAVLFVLSVLNGDFPDIFDWSTTRNAGSALAQLLFLIGFGFTCVNTARQLKNRKKN